MRVYVAGPMRGIPEFNFPAFDEAAEYLRALGHEVCNPADHDREKYGADFGPDSDFDLRDALAWDLDWIARNADAVAVLGGWASSSGATAEVALAHALGLPVASAHWFTERGPARGSAILPSEVMLGAPVAGEVRTTSSTGGEKGTKPARFDLLPAKPLWAVAELYGKGAAKYADRNWERGYEWSKSYAALQRHVNLFWQGVDIDSETGSPHLASVVFHALALMEWSATHPEFDDRPTP